MTLAFPLLVLTCLAQATVPDDLIEEGPLHNDTFLPVSAEAESNLARGDHAWEQGRQTEAFDAWRAALERSDTGSAVRTVSETSSGPRLWPDPDHTHARRSESPVVAVIRRLRTLGGKPLAAWRQRFDPLAATALGRAALNPEAVARVERDHPLTRAAARAALRLCDKAFEEERFAAANLWLERAAEHAEDRAEADLEAAIARRTPGGAAFGPLISTAGEGTWRQAEKLKLEDGLRLQTEMPIALPPIPAPLGRAVEPGLTFLANGSIVVQASTYLVVVNKEGHVARYRQSELLGLGRGGRPYASPNAGGWPLRPASSGQQVALVVGRRTPGKGNALAVLDMSPRDLPAVQWVLSPKGLRRGLGATTPISAVIGAGHWGFQPGPVIIDDLVLAVLRESETLDGEVDSGSRVGDRLWMFAFDLRDGTPRWRRLLTKASDLQSSTAGRFGGSGISTPCAPLTTVGGRVFVGTGSGVGVLLDAVDGRLCWALRNRRRDFAMAGWPGSRPAQVRATTRTERMAAGPVLLWTPFDSDVLYTLRAAADLDGRGMILSPPRRQGEAEDVLAVQADHVLLLSRSGSRRALASMREGQQPIRSLYLGRRERFTGTGLAAPRRALLSSDRGVYLFDLERDMYLMQFLSLADHGAGRGGSLYARGNELYVLGTDTLWTISVR